MKDPRSLTPSQRFAAAEAVRLAADITGFPSLDWFNSAPCDRHATVQEGAQQLPLPCQKCGVALRTHQRIGATWLYFKERALLGDSVGTGKTAQILATLAMMKANDELGLENRAVIVCRAAALWDPWGEQIARLLPDIPFIVAEGSAKKRTEQYMKQWEIAVVSYNNFAPARGKKVTRQGDLEMLEYFHPYTLIVDDVDPMRHHTNRTAYAIKKMAETCGHVIEAHGTSFQKRLMELHSWLEPLGGNQVWGHKGRFRRRYIQTGPSYFYTVGLACTDGHLNTPPAHACIFPLEPMVVEGQPVMRLCGKPLFPDPTFRKVRRQVMVDVGVQNMDEFKPLLAPFVLRREASDIKDVDLPAITVNHVWLDPEPAQKQRYADLRKGVLKKLGEGGEVTMTYARNSFMHGWQICAGLATLDGQGKGDISAKLDWAVDKLSDGGDLSGDKAVVFCNFKPNVLALSHRLEEAGVGHVLLWGDENNPAERKLRREAFREDPAVRVLVGTTTIEQSLNLQVARHLICIDVILNPLRMEQLAGRIRRDGSPFNTVFLHLLLMRGTQEEAYLDLLRREQAVVDAVWEGKSEIWEALPPQQLLQLVARGRVT